MRYNKRIAMIIAIFLAAMLIVPLVLAAILNFAAPEAIGVTQKQINE